MPWCSQIKQDPYIGAETVNFTPLKGDNTFKHKRFAWLNSLGLGDAPSNAFKMRGRNAPMSFSFCFGSCTMQLN